MPKNKSKTAKLLAKQAQPAEKDDGTRWIVVSDERPVYGRKGTIKAEAQRLAEGLESEAYIEQIN